MGRKHFLRDGYAGAVLEQVAEEAGYSRGALYSNFQGKEELFLAVFDTDLHMHVARYHEVLDADMSPEERVEHFRNAFLEHVTDREWGILRTEFELGAVHSEKLRKHFIQIHRRDLDNAIELAQKAINQGDLMLNVPAKEFVLATQSFMMGLSLKQRLLTRQLPMQELRRIAQIFFDCFIATRLNPDGAHTPEKNKAK